MSACEFAWCDVRDVGPHNLHTGVLAVVSADGNDIDVRIVLDLYKGDEELSYRFEWYWGIDSGNTVREFAALRSLLDQIEAVVTEAEKVYPDKFRSLKAGVSA